MTNKIYKVKLLKKEASFSSKQLLIFVLIFGLLGGYLLIRTFAAGTVVATLEAERMVLPTGATVINDTSASGGQAVRLTNSSSLTGSVNLPSQVTSVTINARATAQRCKGAWPSLSISIDGNSLLNSTSVNSTSWNSYSTSTNLGATNHSLTITYNRTSTFAKCNQALYLDVTTFYGPAPAPTPAPTVSLSAAPSSITAGQSSTLTWNSTNATSCTASGAWSGAEPTSGSVSTGALNTTSTYSLTCTGPGGSSTASATVSVTGSNGIPATTATHTVDGNLNESDWQLNYTTSKCVIGSCNNTTTWGAMWDNQYLYVGARVTDSSLVKDSTSCWDDDSVEVYIDADANGGTAYDSNDKQLSQRYNDSALCGSSASTTSGVLHAWVSSNGGYSIEMAIPWSSLGVSPSSGKSVGIDIGNNDDDNGTTRDSQAVAFGTASDYNNPSGFGKLSLTGTGLGTPPPPPPSTSGHFWGTTQSVNLVDSTRTREFQDALAVGMNTLRLDASYSNGDLAKSLGFKQWAVIIGNFRSYPDVNSLANQAISYARRYPDIKLYLEWGNELNFSSMSVQQVCQLHLAMWPLIKNANLSNAKVLLSSIGNGPSSVGSLLPRDWAYQLAANGCMPGKAFDYGNYHAYAMDPASYDQWMGILTPDGSGRSIQRAFGNPPWVLSEFGQSLSGAPGSTTAEKENNQALATGRWMEWAAADPNFIGGMYYNLSDDSPGSGTGYGLRRHDLTHRPSWTTFYNEVNKLH